MSKHETPMTRWYWSQIGGTLIEEFPAVRRGPGHAQRLIDGVIVSGGENTIARASKVEIEGRDIIVVQTKANRLGMYLMGQTVFSCELMKRFNPRSIKGVALCRRSDSIMAPMLESIPHLSVVTCSREQEAEWRAVYDGVGRLD